MAMWETGKGNRSIVGQNWRGKNDQPITTDTGVQHFKTFQRHLLLRKLPLASVSNLAVLTKVWQGLETKPCGRCPV